MDSDIMYTSMFDEDGNGGSLMFMQILDREIARLIFYGSSATCSESEITSGKCR